MRGSITLHPDSIQHQIYYVRMVSHNAIPSRQVLGGSIPIRASINNNIDIYTNGTKLKIDFIDSIVDFNITSNGNASLITPIFCDKDTEI